MWPDRVSNPVPLTCQSGALPTALCGPVIAHCNGRGKIYSLLKIHQQIYRF